jgi:cyclopropane fatty-acyl-phospholipid synthase-like methyltransferase
VLRATHRVLKPGGITAYFVIAVSHEATGTQREEAIAAGPPHVDTDREYPDLMEAAGFHNIEATDVTAEYLETLTAWWREWDTASVELAPIVGQDEFTERQTNRMRAIRPVRAGLLSRYLISATRT